MKVIRFAQDFPKLQDDFFSTIRMPPKDLRTGQEVLIKSPSWEFKAILIKKSTDSLKNLVKDLQTEVFTRDTGTESLDEALDVLRNYYPDLQEDDLMQVLWFIPDRRD